MPDFPDSLTELKKIKLALLAMMTKEQMAQYEQMCRTDGLPDDFYSPEP